MDQGPTGAQHFVVDIDGLDRIDAVRVEGLSTELDVVAWREGNSTGDGRQLVPGLAAPTVVTLTRYADGDLGLRSWLEDAVVRRDHRRNVAVSVLDADRRPVLRVELRGVWPRRHELGPLDARESGPVVERVELVVEELRVRSD